MYDEIVKQVMENPFNYELVSAAPRIATKEEIQTFINDASKLNKEGN